MPIRVYEYGLLPPTINAELVDGQMRGAHRYRNLLVEIEQQRRARVRIAMSSHPDMQPLEDAILETASKRDDARQQILDARKKTRSRSESKEQRELVRELGDKLKDLRDKVKASRAAVAADPDVRLQIDMAETVAHDRLVAARAVCGVYWGTYLLQEADAQRARQERTPPKFRRWSGAGRVSVQLQKGLPLAELFGDDTQIQIAPVSTDAHDPGCARGVRRRASRTVVRIRVGSDAKRKPIWAEWPMIMHRPIPDGSVIKVATVSKRPRDCRTWFWHLQLTVEVPPEAVAAPPTASGAVALNLGYCLRPDGGIRAGYVVATDGYEEEIPVSLRDIEALAKADSIRSFRDRDMNTLQAAYSEWRGTTWPELATPRYEATVALVQARVFQGAIRDDGWHRLCEYIRLDGPALPCWFTKLTSHIHMWKSADRFRRFAFLWREQRFQGDEAGYQLLEAWRYRDEHLQRYEANMRRTALVRRRDGYRLIASRLRQRYHTLVIDDTDLRDLQRSPSPESERTEIATVKANQRIAAGSILRQALLDAFGRRNAKLSGKDMTRRCFDCGHINDIDRLSGNRNHTCSQCGVTWDQDANFGRNLLREYRREHERIALEGAAPTVEVKARWKRVKEGKPVPQEEGSECPPGPRSAARVRGWSDADAAPDLEESASWDQIERRLRHETTSARARPVALDKDT